MRRVVTAACSRHQGPLWGLRRKGDNALMAAWFVVYDERCSWSLLLAIGAAVVLGLILRYVPAFRFLSEGFVIILSAVFGACVAAWLKPVRGEGDA